MVKQKGGRQLNPTDAYRKQLRKKELKKNKKERQRVREISTAKKEPEKIKQKLIQYEQREKEGKLDKTKQQKKKYLEELYEQAIILQKKKEKDQAKLQSTGTSSSTSTSTSSAPKNENETSVQQPTQTNPMYYDAYGMPIYMRQPGMYYMPPNLQQQPDSLQTSTDMRAPGASSEKSENVNDGDELNLEEIQIPDSDSATTASASTTITTEVTSAISDTAVVSTNDNANSIENELENQPQDQSNVQITSTNANNNVNKPSVHGAPVNNNHFPQQYYPPPMYYPGLPPPGYPRAHLPPPHHMGGYMYPPPPPPGYNPYYPPHFHMAPNSPPQQHMGSHMASSSDAEYQQFEPYEPYEESSTRDSPPLQHAPSETTTSVHTIQKKPIHKVPLSQLNMSSESTEVLSMVPTSLRVRNRNVKPSATSTAISNKAKVTKPTSNIKVRKVITVTQNVPAPGTISEGTDNAMAAGMKYMQNERRSESDASKGNTTVKTTTIITSANPISTSVPSVNPYSRIESIKKMGVKRPNIAPNVGDTPTRSSSATLPQYDFKPTYSTIPRTTTAPSVASAQTKPTAKLDAVFDDFMKEMNDLGAT